MVLRDMYNFLDKHHLAIPSIPNVDTITVGGGISNAVHGTCSNAGTLCDFVEELELVVCKSGVPEVLTLRRYFFKKNRILTCQIKYRST